jgi:general L-amino acid transport system substrate-binding protein
LKLRPASVYGTSRTVSVILNEVKNPNPVCLDLAFLQMRRPSHLLLSAAVFLAFFAPPVHAGTTLNRIRQTGILRCGINRETPEYSTSDDHGPRVAFDADICKAVAVAILGPDSRVAVTAYPDDVASVEGLRAGAVDLLPTLTLDFTHSADNRLAFSSPLLYDGVGFLVPRSALISRAAQLSGKKVCFLAETQVEVALRAWFKSRRIKFVPFPFQEEGEMQAAFVTGNCTALAGDRTRLAGTRLAFGPRGSRYALLPEQISKDPLASAMPSADPAFDEIVEWTVEVLTQAEESGLTQHSIAAAEAGSDPASSDPTVQFLAGKTHEIGSRLGLDNSWAAQVIAAVGNYGEIYDRDLGLKSPLKLTRGLNRLYTNGGLMIALPLK